MKMTIESTSQIVELSGVQCRVWEGTTERGVPVTVFIPKVAVADGLPMAEFERDLYDSKRPTVSWPLRMLID